MQIPDLQISLRSLNALIKELKFEQALDQFYSEDIVSVENESASAIGLDAYKEAAKKFLFNISDYSADLLNTIVSNDITVTEWHYKFQHKEWGQWDKIQVSVQRWKNGKIIHERHHYSAN